MKTPLGTEVDLGAGHIVLDGFPALCGRAQHLPLSGPCQLWPRSPISATAELLLFMSYDFQDRDEWTLAIQQQIRSILLQNDSNKSKVCIVLCSYLNKSRKYIYEYIHVVRLIRNLG